MPGATHITGAVPPKKQRREVEQEEEPLGPRMAKVAALEKDWQEIINNRASKSKRTNGDSGESRPCKKVKPTEEESEGRPVVKNAPRRISRPSLKNPILAAKRRIAAMEFEQSEDSSTGSNASIASEDDEPFSDDDLTRKTSRITERDFQDEQVRILPTCPHASARQLFDSDVNVISANATVARGSGLSGPTDASADSPVNAILPSAPLPRKHSTMKISKRDELFMKECAQIATMQKSVSARSVGGSQPSRSSTSRSSLRGDTSIQPSTSFDDDDDDDDIDDTGHHSKTKDQIANEAELQWPRKIRLDHNDGIKVRLQTSAIKTIIAECIHRCELHMITKTAFPETANGERLKLRLVIAKGAVKSLRKKMNNDVYEQAYQRAKEDPKFLHKLGEVAVDRLSHYRSEIRAAATMHIGVYQLGVGQTCEHRVTALLKNNIFVYDGHWGFEDGQEVWLPNQQAAYLNPALIYTIKTAWFGSKRTLGNHHQQAYMSSLPECPSEKEFPIPLVALAATAVHAAISNWKTGFSTGKAAQFKSELVAGTYRTFTISLEKVKARNPRFFHRVMNLLYTNVCGNHTEENDDGAGEDPLAILDLDGM